MQEKCCLTGLFQDYYESRDTIARQNIPRISWKIYTLGKIFLAFELFWKNQYWNGYSWYNVILELVCFEKKCLDYWVILDTFPPGIFVSWKKSYWKMYHAKNHLDITCDSILTEMKFLIPLRVW